MKRTIFHFIALGIWIVSTIYALFFGIAFLTDEMDVFFGSLDHYLFFHILVIINLIIFVLALKMRSVAGSFFGGSGASVVIVFDKNYFLGSALLSLFKGKRFAASLLGLAEAIEADEAEQAFRSGLSVLLLAAFLIGVTVYIRRNRLKTTKTDLKLIRAVIVLLSVLTILIGGLFAYNACQAFALYNEGYPQVRKSLTEYDKMITEHFETLSSGDVIATAEILHQYTGESVTADEIERELKATKEYSYRWDNEYVDLLYSYSQETEEVSFALFSYMRHPNGNLISYCTDEEKSRLRRQAQEGALTLQDLPCPFGVSYEKKLSADSPWKINFQILLSESRSEEDSLLNYLSLAEENGRAVCKTAVLDGKLLFSADSVTLTPQQKKLLDNAVYTYIHAAVYHPTEGDYPSGIHRSIISPNELNLFQIDRDYLDTKLFVTSYIYDVIRGKEKDTYQVDLSVQKQAVGTLNNQYYSLADEENTYRFTVRYDKDKAEITEARNTSNDDYEALLSPAGYQTYIERWENEGIYDPTEEQSIPALDGGIAGEIIRIGKDGKCQYFDYSTYKVTTITLKKKGN